MGLRLPKRSVVIGRKRPKQTLEATRYDFVSWLMLPSGSWRCASCRAERWSARWCPAPACAVAAHHESRDGGTFECIAMKALRFSNGGEVKVVLTAQYLMSRAFSRPCCLVCRLSCRHWALLFWSAARQSCLVWRAD